MSFSDPFVNKFFGFNDFSEAGDFIVKWIRVEKNNPYEFEGNLD